MNVLPIFEEFLEFMGQVLKVNADTAHQNTVVNAVTRDTLQKVCDQLPAIIDDFHTQREAKAQAAANAVDAPDTGAVMPASADTETAATDTPSSAS